MIEQDAPKKRTWKFWAALGAALFVGSAAITGLMEPDEVVETKPAEASSNEMDQTDTVDFVMETFEGRPYIHDAYMRIQRDAYLAFLDRANGKPHDLKKYRLLWQGNAIGFVEITDLPDNESIFYEDQVSVMHRHLKLTGMTETGAQTAWCNIFWDGTTKSGICN